MAELGLTGMYKDMLDVTSVSFAMIELHDKNYLKQTEADNSGGKDIETHSYFAQDGYENEDEAMVERYKRWKTEQPHFLTK